MSKVIFFNQNSKHCFHLEKKKCILIIARDIFTENVSRDWEK